MKDRQSVYYCFMGKTYYIICRRISVGVNTGIPKPSKSFLKFSDCLICHINAMGIFFHKIVDVGNRRSSLKESISISEEMSQSIPRKESTAEIWGFVDMKPKAE